jgi:hypothetical protein
MLRWPLLTAFSMACALAGCTQTIRPGLANVPRVGGSSPPDDGVHDVVANGDDSCGVHAEQGPLRNRWPPCPSTAHPVATAELLPGYIGLHESIVLPWLEHFYVGFPCPHPAGKPENSGSAKSVAWSPSPPHAKSCAVP